MGIQAANKTVTTPGTPVKLYQPDATHPALGGSHIAIQADAKNAGLVYVGTQGMVKGTTPATRVNVLAILAAGEVWPPSEFVVNPEFMYVDADTANDGVSVAING